jgi:hypothetical protein
VRLRDDRILDLHSRRFRLPVPVLR